MKVPTIPGCISENTAVRMASQEVIRQCPLNLSPHNLSMHHGQYSGTYGQPGIYSSLSSPSSVPLSSYLQKLVYLVATQFL